jgi:hypothetical protein
LRPWRDGWRHLRYLLMLSPYWVFALPASVLGTVALSVLVTLTAIWLASAGPMRVGNYWEIVAGSTLAVSHIGIIFALAGQLYGIRERYRTAPPFLRSLASWLTLESMLLGGLGAIVVGFAILLGVLVYRSTNTVDPISTVLPVVLGTTAVAMGAQSIFGGFLLAIVAGNDASFLKELDMRPRDGERQAEHHGPALARLDLASQVLVLPAGAESYAPLIEQARACGLRVLCEEPVAVDVAASAAAAVVDIDPSERHRGPDQDQPQPTLARRA